MALDFELQLEQERNIRGSVFPARSEAVATLIVCHGFKGFKDWGFFPYAAERLAENMDVVTFNFSHNGVGADLLEFTELEKFEKNTYSLELEDVDTLVLAVASGRIGNAAAVKSAPIFLLGHSKGAGSSLIYALDNPGQVAGVISWNGIANVNIYSKENIDEMKSVGRSYTLNGRTQQQMPLDKVIIDDIESNRDRFDIIGRIAHIQVPVAFIQGSKDHDRLLLGTEKLLAQYPSARHVVIEGGNHTFNTVHPFQGETPQLHEAIEQTKRFVADCLKQNH
ncbi:alpha/beta hydrolase family protein [Paenibacillus thalictri]|uniref:Alpha/beta hydrolase n=1 Tax=Paenibacillus thalictri TaxID=2527873 RepID=A0A4Q9DPI1_9BACL|nr:alpha/beta hydrolase [Paenibacillus thalictri]TBL78215.1 alpha/beta hydrolase [Paenibacillus thalictri]